MPLLIIAAYLWGGFFIVIFLVMMKMIVRELLVDMHSPLVCMVEGHEWLCAGWDNHTFNPIEVPKDQILDLWYCWKCNVRKQRLRHYQAPYRGGLNELEK